MTMRELANLANVSVSTVSKAFHDADDISEETRQRVFAVAREHGCYGKFYKGKFHKQIIAVICPELVGSFYTAYIEALQRIIRSHNGIVLVSADHFDPAAQAELLDYYASYLQVDGIIALGLSCNIKKGYDIPIVSVFSAPDPTIDTINLDLETPLREAVCHLRSLGHKQIAFIGEQHTHLKARIFRRVIEEDTPTIIESKLRFESAGEDGICQLLEQAPGCTAAICAYDNIALGAIRQLRSLGFKVPEDFSVVGIDNISVSEYTQLPLSTIDTNPEEVCMLAWDIIQKKQQSKYYRSRQAITITGQLILRSTTGTCKK